MTEEQIDYMVQRFLSWPIPEDFSPDGGITFVDDSLAATNDPALNGPFGTNLFDARQAKEMVRHMLDGMPESVDCIDTIERKIDSLTHELGDTRTTIDKRLSFIVCKIEQITG